MKHRLTSFAAVAVLADLLVMGTAWHTGPALALTAGLTVPGVEPLLATLYAEPVHRDVRLKDGTAPELGADLYRPARPRSAVVLLDDASAANAAERIRIARALARREIAVLVPHAAASADVETRALAYARALGVPASVATLEMLRQDAAPAGSPLARAGDAWRRLQLVTTLLAAR